MAESPRGTPDPPLVAVAEDLSSWRARILQSLLTSCALGGAVACVPSVWLLLRGGLLAVAVINTLAYAMVVALALWRGGRREVRASVFLALGQLVGVLLLVEVGPAGAGYLWLFSVPLIAGVLLGFRVSLYASGLNAVTLAAIGVLVARGDIAWSGTFSLASFAVIAVNFVLLNTLTAASLATLLRGLETSLDRLGAEVIERRRAEAERESLARELLQARKMEALGTLAGGIAHDFNNILQALFGYAEMVRAAVEPESRARRHIDSVLAAAGRGRDLVARILSFSRQSEPLLRPLDLVQAAQEALHLLRATMPPTIDLRFEAPDRDVVVRADATQLQQVLMNLGTNAAHALSEAGGRLTVAVAAEDLTPAESDRRGIAQRCARVTFEDTGPGIDQEILDRIFEPYFTTRRGGRGSGLGLAVVHGIVKSFGGTIEVTSKLGTGTRFDVLFPRCEDEQVATRPPDAVPILASGRARVLLVDDEVSIVEITCEVLGRLGYDALGMTDPEEALALFLRDPHRFDLVITDLTMPRLGGDVLATRMLELRPDLPIVLLTGYQEAMTRERVRSLGIRELALKPLDIVELGRVVHQALLPPSKTR
jgi:signal transduction histidine kinase/CheY-like chemotaxis protein